MSRVIRTGGKALIGPNVKRAEGWKQRLIDASEGMSYRDIGKNALSADGEPVMHTTIRSALTDGNAGIRLDTFLAVCDGLGVEAATIIGLGQGPRMTTPKGLRGLTKFPRLSMIPVLPADEAAQWPEKAQLPESYAESENVFVTVDNGEQLMAIRAIDNSMQPEIVKGDIVLYVARDPKPEDLVVVEMVEQDLSMIRQWVPSKDGTRIKLAGAGTETIVAAAKVKALGVVQRIVRDVA